MFHKLNPRMMTHTGTGIILGGIAWSGFLSYDNSITIVIGPVELAKVQDTYYEQTDDKVSTIWFVEIFLLK